MLYLHEITMAKRNTIFIFLLGLTAILFLITCSKTNNTPIYTTNCADSLIGDYSGSDYCASSGQFSYTCNLSAATTTNITFSNLGSGTNVTAIVNCSNNTITIPSQTFSNNSSISGSGTYTANRIIINWSGLSLGSPVNCSTTLTR